MKEKVALVTGSTSGIGLAIAKSLAAGGCRVMLNGSRDSNAAAPLLNELKKDYDVGYAGADLRNPSAIIRMIEACRNTFGEIDILVNNAGIQHVAPVEEFSPEMWDAILALNLSSAFHTTRAVIPGMKNRGWGRIVNISSIHGLVASPYKAAYVSAKHGLVGFTKVVALETAKDGITCNAVCPAYVLTALVEKQIAGQATSHGIQKSEVCDMLLGGQPTGRFIETDEIGDLVRFLCSDAARSITGVAIPVDGGWTSK